MWFEERLIFRPSRASRTWQPPGSLQARDVWLQSGGLRLHAWWCPVPDPAYTVLYCHGTAGNLSTRQEAIKHWQEIVRASVLIFDYPGYGKSEGRPSEQGCYAAGQAAYEHLRTELGIDGYKIVLYGGSLGGGVATELAMRVEHRALVLLATFTSVLDMAHKSAPHLPVEWLLRTRFDNRGKLRSYHGPLFIGHGTADHLVPFHQARQNYQACPAERKELLALRGLDHTEAAVPQFFAAVGAWLGKLTR